MTILRLEDLAHSSGLGDLDLIYKSDLGNVWTWSYDRECVILGHVMENVSSSFMSWPL
jgi:hypothetical protein